MKIGLGIGAGIGEEGNLGQMLAAFERAESAGFDAAWMANVFAFDAVMMLALAGRVTSRLEVGTFVVPTYPRHPMALAQQALTASAATNGRFTLGIGLSHKVVIENMLGLDYSKPVRHMREYLSVLTPLLSGEQVMYRGEEYRVMARLAVPDAPKPPVIVAALGPQMLRLAGKLADGTATWMGGARYLREAAIPTIRAAAAEAGRPAPRIVSGFPIAVTSRVDNAKEAAAKVYANYGALPSYRAVLDVEGAPGPADIAIIGSEEEVEAQVRQLAADGVTDFNASLFAVEGDTAARDRTYELLAGLAKAGI